MHAYIHMYIHILNAYIYIDSPVSISYVYMAMCSSLCLSLSLCPQVHMAEIASALAAEGSLPMNEGGKSHVHVYVCMCVCCVCSLHICMGVCTRMCVYYVCV